MIGQQGQLDPGFRQVCQASDDKPFLLLKQTSELGVPSWDLSSTIQELARPGRSSLSPRVSGHREHTCVKSVGELLGALSGGPAAHLPLSQACW